MAKLPNRSKFKPIFSLRVRYQQSSVAVFAKFFAESYDSGRKEYFPFRKSELIVTDLIDSFRLTNGQVAQLRDGVIQGKQPGKTEIQA